MLDWHERPCILWIGDINSKGYPERQSRNYVRKAAYVWAFIDLWGELPDGTEIDHLCTNIICINPWHLDAVTSQENKRRSSLRQILCINNHEYTVSNTYVSNKGKECRICRRNSVIKFRREKSNGILFSMR